MSPKRDIDRSIIFANDCIPHLVASASLEYQCLRSQGIANKAEREGRDTSWRKIILAAGTRFWICEMIAETRASGAGGVASIFHVTRTSLEFRASWTFSLGHGSALVLVVMSVKERGAHWLEGVLNLFED